MHARANNRAPTTTPVIGRHIGGTTHGRRGWSRRFSRGRCRPRRSCWAGVTGFSGRGQFGDQPHVLKLKSPIRRKDFCIYLDLELLRVLGLVADTSHKHFATQDRDGSGLRENPRASSCRKVRATRSVCSRKRTFEIQGLKRSGQTVDRNRRSARRMDVTPGAIGQGAPRYRCSNLGASSASRTGTKHGRSTETPRLNGAMSAQASSASGPRSRHLRHGQGPRTGVADPVVVAS